MKTPNFKSKANNNMASNVFCQQFSFKNILGVGYSEYLIILSLFSIFSIAAFENYSQVIQGQTSHMSGELSGESAVAQQSSATTRSPSHQRLHRPEGFITASEVQPQSTKDTASPHSLNNSAIGGATHDLSPEDNAQDSVQSSPSHSSSTQTTVEKPLLQRILTHLTQFSNGLIKGVKSQGQGMLDMILHPIETAKAIYSLAEMLVDNPAAVAQAILDEFQGQLEAIQSADVHATGIFIGENISPAAIMSVVKKAAVVGKVAVSLHKKPQGRTKKSKNTNDNSKDPNACCCFAKGTVVAVEDGFKAIELLQKGDIVYSFNQATGHTELQPVTHTFITKGKILYALTTLAQGKLETVQVTDNHPYWVINQGWTDSIQLTEGDQLLQKTGQIAVVAGLINLGFTETTYNLEVANNHTYFVGESQILVHNESRNCRCTLGDGNEGESGDTLPHVAQSPVEYDHVLKGDFNRKGRATGGHSLHNDNVRIMPGTQSAPDVHGVYTATIQVKHPETGKWIKKNNARHSMFPESWSENRIKREIDSAWNHPNKIEFGDNEWRSTSSSGVTVGGYTFPRITAFPVKS